MNEKRKSILVLMKRPSVPSLILGMRENYCEPPSTSFLPIASFDAMKPHPGREKQCVKNVPGYPVCVRNRLQSHNSIIFPCPVQLKNFLYAAFSLARLAAAAFLTSASSFATAAFSRSTF